MSHHKLYSYTPLSTHILYYELEIVQTLAVCRLKETSIYFFFFLNSKRNMHFALDSPRLYLTSYSLIGKPWSYLFGICPGQENYISQCGKISQFTFHNSGEQGQLQGTKVVKLFFWPFHLRICRFYLLNGD